MVRACQAGLQRAAWARRAPRERGDVGASPAVLRDRFADFAKLGGRVLVSQGLKRLADAGGADQDALRMAACKL